MALSRYANFKTIIDKDKNTPRLETFPQIFAEELKDDANDIIIKYKDGMRLDTIAFQYLGDGRYWWAICLLNDISFPFMESVTPGINLRIPTNISRILDIIDSKLNQA